MEFYVYFSNSKSLRNKSKLDLIANDDLLAYDFINNFHCFKFKKIQRIASSGVEKSNDEIIDTKNFLAENDGKQIVSLAFVFINTENGYIYCHNYSSKLLKEMFLKFFKTTDYSPGVDAEKLNKISNIEITFSGDPRLNQFNNILTKEALSIDEALDLTDAAIKSATVKILMEKPVLFNKDKLSNILKNYTNVTIKGFDQNENVIKIAKEIQLIVNIGMEYDSFEGLKAKTFDEIIAKINEQYEAGGLNAYQNNS